MNSGTTSQLLPVIQEAMPEQQDDIQDHASSNLGSIRKIQTFQDNFEQFSEQKTLARLNYQKPINPFASSLNHRLNSESQCFQPTYESQIIKRVSEMVKNCLNFSIEHTHNQNRHNVLKANKNIADTIQRPPSPQIIQIKYLREVKTAQKFRIKHANYNINYNIRVYWAQFLELEPDKWKHPEQNYDQKYEGVDFWQAVNLGQQSTVNIIIKSLLEKRIGQHPSNKTIRILDHNFSSNSSVNLNAKTTNLRISISIKKIYTSPIFNCSYQSLYQRESQKIIKEFIVQSQYLKLIWHGEILINNVDFYHDIKLKDQTPLLSPYLLSKVAIKLKSRCPLTRSEFIRQLYINNK